MKRTWFWIPVAVIVIALILLLLAHGGVFESEQDATVPTATESTTTTEPAAPEAPIHLTFKGKVLEIDGDSVLMECHDKNKFDTVWVYFAQTDATPQIGQEYTVTYEDMVMPSLPPRITAVEMELVYSAPLTE